VNEHKLVKCTDFPPCTKKRTNVLDCQSSSCPGRINSKTNYSS